MSRVVMPRAYSAMIRSLNPHQPGLAIAHDPRLEAAIAVPRRHHGGHDLGDESAERLDPGRGLAAAEHFGAGHVPGGQVLQRAAAGVFELGARPAGSRAGGSGPAAASRWRRWSSVRTMRYRLVRGIAAPFNEGTTTSLRGSADPTYVTVIMSGAT